MNKLELEQTYQQYIELLALDMFENKPINNSLLDKIIQIQTQIRNQDILEAVKNLAKEDTVQFTTTPVRIASQYDKIQEFHTLVSQNLAQNNQSRKK